MPNGLSCKVTKGWLIETEVALIPISNSKWELLLELLMGISAISGPISQPHRMKIKINKIHELCRIVADKVKI